MEEHQTPFLTREMGFLFSKERRPIMKKPFYFLIFFPLLLSLSCCGGGSDSGGGVSTTPATFTPSAGTWSGTIIQFNVSTNGSSITSNGSSLEDDAAVLFGPVQYSGACDGPYSLIIIATYPITNNTFSFTTLGGLTITGRFTGPYNANGTYSYIHSMCGGTVTASGSWTASLAA
jgi:hypothetical protein